MTFSVTIVHASDLHLSGDIVSSLAVSREAKRHYAPHRHGHHPESFLAFDQWLKDNPWDILVLSGDLTRTGDHASMIFAYNWLHGTNVIGAGRTVGLDIRPGSVRKVVVVPGNHDAFNGSWTQSSLRAFQSLFSDFRSGSLLSQQINGVDVEFLTLDSTAAPGGGFAAGSIDSLEVANPTPRGKAPSLRLAVVHHHLALPPEHTEARGTGARGSAKATAKLIGLGYDGVFFGHTHKSFLRTVNSGVLMAHLEQNRRTRRLWTRVLPKTLLYSMAGGGPLVDYPRIPCASGKFPTYHRYLAYLVYCARHPGAPSLSSFKTLAHFDDWYDVHGVERIYAEWQSRALAKKLLVSMAPSACQAEAARKGFHVVRYEFGSPTPTVSAQAYEYRVDQRFSMTWPEERVWAL